MKDEYTYLCFILTSIPEKNFVSAIYVINPRQMINQFDRCWVPFIVNILDKGAQYIKLTIVKRIFSGISEMNQAWKWRDEASNY